MARIPARRFAQNFFGNLNPVPSGQSPETWNGFASVQTHDTNHDGLLEARDALFANLRLWVDSNGDGVVQPAELLTLHSHGITGFELNSKESKQVDVQGNELKYRAKVLTNKNGEDVARWADVYLKSEPLSKTTGTTKDHLK